MKKKADKPRFVPVDEGDLDPGHRWHRPLQAPGITQVDFEERIDFRRLHRYRLARTRQSLAASGLGAMLCFDQHNIRYISSTVIGEWARDKLIRYCLLTGTGDPWIWDLAPPRPPQALLPWLHEDHVHAGNPGMRAIGPESAVRGGRPRIKDILVGRRGGHASARPDRSQACSSRCRRRASSRDGRQVMLAALVKSRRDHAAQHRGLDGRRVTGHHRGVETRREGEPIVALATSRLFEMGSTVSRRSTPSPANAAARIRTTSPTA